MRFSQRIVYHLPEDSAFFPEDRMRFYQRINMHFPEDRLCHFPKTFYYSLWLYFITIISIRKTLFNYYIGLTDTVFSGQQKKYSLEEI